MTIRYSGKALLKSKHLKVTLGKTTKETGKLKNKMF